MKLKNNSDTYIHFPTRLDPIRMEPGEVVDVPERFAMQLMFRYPFVGIYKEKVKAVAVEQEKPARKKKAAPKKRVVKKRVKKEDK